MKLKCQCPICHCLNEYEEANEKAVDLYPLSNESIIDTKEDVRYLESKTHLAICPMCTRGEHVVFE